GALPAGRRSCPPGKYCRGRNLRCAATDGRPWLDPARRDRRRRGPLGGADDSDRPPGWRDGANFGKSWVRSGVDLRGRMHGMEAQLLEAVEAIRPALQADGGDIRVVNLDEETGVVEIELMGAC